MLAWGKFLQENFDKLLLFSLFIFSLFFVLHIQHDVKDADLLAWGREMSGTVLGALLGLITGHVIASRQIQGQTQGPPQPPLAGTPGITPGAATAAGTGAEA